MAEKRARTQLLMTASRDDITIANWHTRSTTLSFALRRRCHLNGRASVVVIGGVSGG